MIAPAKSPEQIAGEGNRFDVTELFRRPAAGRVTEPRQATSLRTFRELLKTEIRWADRARATLTFLIFDVAAQNGDTTLRDEGLDCLAAVIPACTRRTDTVGWFEDRGERRLGLILHATAPERARSVIANLRERFLAAMTKRHPDEAGLPELTCDIFSYPWRSTPDAIDPRQLTLFDDKVGKQKTVAGVRISQNGDLFRGTKIGRYPGMDAITPASRIMGHPHPRSKRAIDFFGSLFLLILFSPLFIAAALAVKLTSKGPIFFRQDRVGHRGRIYTCLKFRSMVHNYDSTKHKEYLKKLIKSASSADDGIPMKKLDGVNPQITKVGRLLRKTSIDELPQLINVLRGEMSLVGPRPCVPYEAVEFLCWHTRRFDTVPGMTGLWQVMGKNRTTFKEMIRLDIRYGLHQSLLFDLKIFLMTLPAVLRDYRAASKPA